jgi:hypothetical protein
MRTERATFAGIAVALIAVLVYLPSLTTGFNADDYLILWRVKAIEGLGDPLGYFKFAFYEYFRPLGFLSYALDWRVWHLDAFGFHLTNLALHAANSFLVFRLARRLLPTPAAIVAGLLFALHPASHEVVYWIAARFDLLATFFGLLALALLARPEQRWRIAGALAFGLALLAKESAISLLIIAPAWDAVVDRRGFRTTARRLLPLLAVLAVYIAIRSFGAELDATVGSRRLPKAIMTLVGLAVVLWIAWNRRFEGPKVRGSEGPRVLRTSGSRVLGLAGAVVALGLVVAPQWVFEKLGFVTHVVFYAVSPVIFPAPRAEWFNPASVVGSLPHLVLLALIGLLAWSLTRSTESDNRRDLGFAVLFIAAALLPVSSMTGGLRYLYLPTVGVALLGAALLSRMSKHAQLIAAAAVAVMLAISAQQIVHAGRAWRTASTVTREGVELMAGSLGRCGSDDVLLFTTPVAIGNIYANLSWDAFDVLANCTPRNFMTLLRVVGSDLQVSITSTAPDIVELRVPNYAGNIVASRDLRNFVIPVTAGDTTSLDTAAGRLETFPEGSTQVFRLTMTMEARAARRFYYSDGRIRQ